jgi:hypothetical protein
MCGQFCLCKFFLELESYICSCAKNKQQQQQASKIGRKKEKKKKRKEEKKMKEIVVSLVFISISMLIFGLVIFWHESSHVKFENKNMVAGEKYDVEGRQYEFPDVPIDGKVYPLKQSVMISLRDLYKSTVGLLEDRGVGYWVSGGTLLGFMRHGTFMPNDDDIDLHVPLEFKGLLFSEEMSVAAKAAGLELIFLRGSGEDNATKEGGAVRVRKTGTRFPIADIFFVEEVDGFVNKIDSWKTVNGKLVLAYNKVERWPASYVLPSIVRSIDGLDVSLPAMPVEVLAQQYGKNCMSKVVVRSRWISHSFPFEKLPFMWTTTTPLRKAAATATGSLMKSHGKPQPK